MNIDKPTTVVVTLRNVNSILILKHNDQVDYILEWMSFLVKVLGFKTNILRFRPYFSPALYSIHKLFNTNFLSSVNGKDLWSVPICR